MAPRKKGISGSFPQFGAIFMCNMMTKEECFNRKIFGLPLSFSQFVENVKAGMILFLFEHQKKNLYGVFEAVSDGGIDIAPCAYHSSGRSFPAQVQFRIIWRCQPVSELHFRDAIKENYYAPRKFNFGLSKDQVHRLLCLFDAKRIKPQNSFGEIQVKQPSRSSDYGNPSFDLDPVKFSAQSFDCSSRSEPDLSMDAEESTFGHPRASIVDNCISTASAPENLNLSKNGSDQKLKQTELVDVSLSASFELGDFIPVSSPDDCEPAEVETSLGASTSDDSYILPALVSKPCDPTEPSCKEREFVDTSYSASLDFVDFIPLPSSPDSSKSTENEILFEQTDLDGSSASASEHYPRVKGLYSDAQGSRQSVFSRMKLNAKCAVRENEVDRHIPSRNVQKKRQRSFVEDESLELIMENLVQRQQSWKKHRNETNSVVRKVENSNRPNVFSRLSSSSEVMRGQAHYTTVGQ